MGTPRRTHGFASALAGKIHMNMITIRIENIHLSDSESRHLRELKIHAFPL